MNRLLISCISLLIFGISCTSSDRSTENEKDESKVPIPATLLYDIVDTIRHDTQAFTEGFEFYQGKLYESTGQYGKTAIRVIDTASGRLISQVKNPDMRIFGEGISHVNHKLYQLTYQSHQVFVYDEDNLHQKVAELSWPKEGWGLSHDSTSLLLSDGSATIHYIRPEGFTVIKTLSIQDRNGAVDQLNELEFINGFIYANRWHHDQILKIDPATGYVVGELHFEGILEQYAPSFHRGEEDVLNGIAWDQENRVMYVTGKNWPLIFKVKLR